MMSGCTDALFKNKDFSSVEGSEQIQVHFVITDHTIVFNFLFESLGFLFFQIVGTTIAEVISFKNYKEITINTVF